jgi:hypothetical protein
MENKKQLIIIPPMSEALSKLNTVLQSISAEENMEITVIDDLKELSQFLGTTGQCLILASNAKKCASFLQDNKTLLLKFHCKTILFTPKEIPAKTLIKFTKVGLTESILESSPPKTFLYKVKLLLRSIKTAKPQDDADKTVKSLEAMKSLAEEYELEAKEKSPENEEAASYELPEKKKRNENVETVDYGGSLKGKNKHQEEAINTNWKSDKKLNDSISLEDSLEEEKPDGEVDNIDMYYRGKQKTNSETLPEEDLLGISKATEAAVEIAKKKSSYADVIDEGSIKQKRLETAEEIEAQAQSSLDSLELELIAAKKKKKALAEEAAAAEMNYVNKAEVPEEELSEREKQIELLLEKAAKKKAETIEPADEELDLKEKEMAYDNSEVDRNRKKKSVELDLEKGEQEITKKAEAQSDNGPDLDNEVEKIDTNMTGSEGKVDHIETMMISKTNKTEKTPEEEKDSKDLDLGAPAAAADEMANYDRDNPFGLGLSDDEQEAELEKKQEEELLAIQKRAPGLELESGAKKEKNKALDEDLNDKDLRLTKLEESQSEEKNKNPNLTLDEDELNLRSSDKSSQKEEAERNHSHDGQVDKIDTFYRSGESKKKDHNWDNLNKKNDSIKLDLVNKARDADGTIAKVKKDQGEVTIDYRKLKEEFDLMASGDGVGANHGSRAHDLGQSKNNEDAGSFKVIELDSKSLDFSISIVNAIYEKDIKAKKIFAMLAEELLSNYHCFPVFYSYKTHEKKFNEVFNIFAETADAQKISLERKDWWDEYKKDTALFEHFQTKSMTTWRCAEVIKEGFAWEDVELPTWADQELRNKHVELIFPYFDGIDRMGMAVILFPDGIDPKSSNSILTVLEMARTLFLDTIERYQVKPLSPLLDELEVAPGEPVVEDKKGVLNFFGGLFGKKKAS